MKTAQKLSTKQLISVMVIGAILFFYISTNLPNVLAQTPEIDVVDQNQVTLTAIPPRLGEDNSLKAKPGEKLQVQLRVRNLSEQAVNVTTSAQDFVIGDDGETPIAINDSISNRWSLASWLTIIPTENKIESNQTIGLNVLIEIPQDALPGGHYAMILHQPNKLTNTFEIQGDSQSSINQKVGTVLYVIVEGVINEEAYIRNFTFPEFTEYGPVPFSFSIENNSDIHITPQMNIEILDIFNRKVDDIQINSKNVFPLHSRDFEGEWRRIWGFGPYSAKLTASFGSSGSIVVANTKFWLLPIKLLIAIIAGILIILVLILSIKKHLNHRRDQDKKKIADLENQIQEINSNVSDQNDTLQK